MSKCPICGQPSVEKHRPFCSKRCGDIDLGRWLTGSYVIPAGPDDEEDPLPQPTDAPKPH